MAKANRNPTVKVVPKVIEDTAYMILTYDGTEAPLSACRKIDKLFYTVGDINIKDSGQCYLMDDGKYYRVSANRIAWDHRLYKYNYINNMILGFVVGGEMGYFTKNIFNNVYAKVNGQDFICIDEIAARNKHLSYNFTIGKWVDPEIMPTSTRLYQGVRPVYPGFEPKVSSMSEHPQLQEVTDAYAEYPKHASRLDQYLYDYSIGQEIETDGGWLPKHYYYRHGALPLYDGSINGTEVTTIPMSGLGTINNLVNLYNVLGKYTSVTSNTSLHINVGNVPNTPEFRVALYVFYFRLQQEINAFIPRYKKDLEYLKNKKGGMKDHCKDLANLDIVYRYSNEVDVFDQQIKNSDNIIFSFLHEGRPKNAGEFGRKHFKEGLPKWDWYNRYYSLNFMPLYFGNEAAARIEYRVHSGTVNATKAIIWTLICTAITKFVDNNSRRILQGRDKILLEDVINEMFDEKDANLINAYINCRKTENSLAIINHSTDLYGGEFKYDSTYAFNICDKNTAKPYTLFDE